MKFKVKIYMKSGNVLDYTFSELEWAALNKQLTWKMSDYKYQQLIWIDTSQIEAIVQYGAA